MPEMLQSVIKRYPLHDCEDEDLTFGTSNELDMPRICPQNTPSLLDGEGSGSLRHRYLNDMLNIPRVRPHDSAARLVESKGDDGADNSYSASNYSNDNELSVLLTPRKYDEQKEKAETPSNGSTLVEKDGSMIIDDFNISQAEFAVAAYESPTKEAELSSNCTSITIAEPYTQRAPTRHIHHHSVTLRQLEEKQDIEYFYSPTTEKHTRIRTLDPNFVDWGKIHHAINRAKNEEYQANKNKAEEGEHSDIEADIKASQAVIDERRQADNQDENNNKSAGFHPLPQLPRNEKRDEQEWKSRGMEVLGHGLQLLSAITVQIETVEGDLREFIAKVDKKLYNVLRVAPFVLSLRKLRTEIHSFSLEIGSGALKTWQVFEGHDEDRIRLTYNNVSSESQIRHILLHVLTPSDVFEA